MSFDTTAADLEDFFKDCAVTNVRIVEDKLDRKPKGFAYVEFGTLDGLKKALSYGGTSLGGRMVRVSVAEPRKCGSLVTYRNFSVDDYFQRKKKRALAILAIGVGKALCLICHNREESLIAEASVTDLIVVHQMQEATALQVDVVSNPMAKFGTSVTGNVKDHCLPWLPPQEA